MATFIDIGKFFLFTLLITNNDICSVLVCSYLVKLETSPTAENTDLLHKVKYDFTADLLFDWLGIQLLWLC